MGYKGEKRTLTIERVDRLVSSQYGNPRFRVTFTDGTVADTQTDASIAYEMENVELRGVPLEVTFSRAGTIIYAQPIGPNV